MASYDIKMLTFGELDGFISLPSYQRPVVWTASEKMNFITNLHKGFPFGSLLLYRYPDDLSKYTLIDGQQRYTTMRGYASEPARYFPIGDYPFIEELLHAIKADSLPLDAQNDLASKFNKIVEKLLSEYASAPKPFPPLHLRNEVEKVYPLLHSDETARDKLIELQAEIIDAFDNYLSIDAIKIPCIIFEGKQSDLPDVFASVNLGGRKLTKYQVFSAQWNRYSVQLASAPESNQLLDDTIERYEQLTSDRSGLEIEDFDADGMRDSRKVTLPEFCHALGQEILRVSPACWPAKTREQDDAIDTIGYNTLAIVFGIKPQSINELAETFYKAELTEAPDTLNMLVADILAEYRTINREFSLYLHRPGKDSGSSDPADFENSKAMGQLQFLSFFAALWRIKYGLSSTTFEPLPHYKADYEQTRRNIFGSYLIDLLGNQWKGSGDSRLASYISGDRTYLSGLTSGTLLGALNNWAAEEDQAPSINIDTVTKILLTVFASAEPENYTAASYDFEHIISRKLLNEKDANGTPRYKALVLAGGRIGNIMLLQSSQNRGKREKNLGTLAGEELEINQERNFLPSKNDLKEIEFSLKGNNAAPFKQMTKTRQDEIFYTIEGRIIH